MGDQTLLLSANVHGDIQEEEMKNDGYFIEQLQEEDKLIA